MGKTLLMGERTGDGVQIRAGTARGVAIEEVTTLLAPNSPCETTDSKLRLRGCGLRSPVRGGGGTAIRLEKTPFIAVFSLEFDR